MSKELVAAAASKGLVAMVMTESAAFADAANELGANIGGLFGFSGNDGKWKYKGQEIEHGTQIAVAPDRMRKGFVCWKGGRPIDKVAEKILGGGPLPRQVDLEDHGPYDNDSDGWRSLVELPMRFTDTGEEADISLSSTGGVNALLRLGQEWATKAKMNIGANGQKKVAIVEIGADAFQPKNIPGKKYAPVLKIVDWVDASELQSVIDDASPIDEGDVPAVVEVAKTTPAAKAAGFKRPGTRV